MSAKHTPGPWRISENGRFILGPRAGEENLPVILASFYHERLPVTSNEANARLIAAAPTLALIMGLAVEMLAGKPSRSEITTVRAMLAVELAKATGCGSLDGHEVMPGRAIPIEKSGTVIPRESAAPELLDALQRLTHPMASDDDMDNARAKSLS